jgi:hypothetical protein
LTDDSRVARLRPYLILALAISLFIGFLVWIMPTRVRVWLRRGNKNSILDGWCLLRSLQLLPLRFVYFAILIVYGAVALSILLLLSPDERNPTLVAMSLFWTIGMIVGRLIIATAHLWLQRTRYGVSLRGMRPLPSEVAQAERSMHV